jgi:hypothetical protein
MVNEKSLSNLVKGAKFKFTSETAKAAAHKSALVRRVPDFKSPLYTEIEKEAEKFSGSRVKRIKKQLLMCDLLFDRESKRSKPDADRLNRIIEAQTRLEKKLSGQPVQPKTTSDPVKSDVPEV